MISHAEQRQPRKHLTARLALKLLEDTPENLHSNTGGSPVSPVHRKTVSLQRALRNSGDIIAPTTAKGKGASFTLDLSHTTASSSSTTTTNSTLATIVDSRPASFGSSDESSVASWEGEDDGFVFEDRHRSGAGASTVDFIDDTLLLQLEQRSSAIRRQQQSCNEGSDTNPLEEFDHPALQGAIAALHGYAASDGDTVFLEKAYELARAVAGSKHTLGVSFDACRVVLAVGYVHILIKGAPDLADKFAHQHSLPKLAQSLKPYWSRSPSPTPDEEAEWEECVSSLLEVTSSIALMTDERDIWTVLDRDPFGEVAEAMGLYLVRRPNALQQYQDVGSACLRHNFLYTESCNRSLTDSE
ncbi:unnamed protein product [Ectocarpus sp. CCAP 1310/34]|nr:unnamed protein product [Ectocarpus sp. CCAP 1310/34]